MSELLKKIKIDLTNAMKREVEFRKMNIRSGENYEWNKSIIEFSRAIISMFPEIGVKPDKASDSDTIRLLKKYINMEKTRQLYVGKHLTESDVVGISSSELNKLVSDKMNELAEKLTSPKIEIAMSYLPKSLSEDELIQWIKDNVDFSQFKNKMQAMKIIMSAHEGLDGNIAKQVLLKHF